MSEWRQKRRVMRRYDLTAHLYDVRYAEEQEAKYIIALENVRMTGNSVVLDVGCGTGLLFSHVGATAGTVVGVDFSRKLLLQAKEHAENFQTVHLVQADADHLPLKNGYFSVVFAFTVLQNMPKPAETLNEIERTAIHGAYIVVTGMKKTFSLEAFVELLQQARLHVVSLKDDETVKCYVAVSLRSPA